MNCEIFKILYLRANTEVACNCGSGERVNLGWLSEEEGWSATAFFANPRYQHMAAALARGEMPWGEVCRRCVFLRPHEPFSNRLAEKRLEKVHVEPSLACALRCPGCSRIHQIKERRGSVFLPVPVYRRLLASLAAEGFSIEMFYFCGQGEPLSHPQLTELVAACREFFPETRVVINTNGNYRFAEVFPPGTYPDQLIVSVDGLHQHSYEQYRIRGDVEKALTFMHDAKRAPGRPPIVEWKYILFKYNDSNEELLAAQQRAEQLGVDSLQFVITHTPEKSTRFTPETVLDLPIVSPIAYPETTPHLYFKRPLAVPLSPHHSGLIPDFAGAGQVMCVVDECRYGARRLLLRGWALGIDGCAPRSLGVRINGEPRGRAVLGLAREDVRAAFPQYPQIAPGFRATCELPAAVGDQPLGVTLDYETPDGTVYPMEITYSLLASSESIYNRDCP